MRSSPSHTYRAPAELRPGALADAIRRAVDATGLERAIERSAKEHGFEAEYRAPESAACDLKFTIEEHLGDEFRQSTAASLRDLQSITDPRRLEEISGVAPHGLFYSAINPFAGAMSVLVMAKEPVAGSRNSSTSSSKRLGFGGDRRAVKRRRETRPTR